MTTTEEAIAFVDHAMRNWPLNGMGIITDDLEDLRAALEWRDAQIRREERDTLLADHARAIAEAVEREEEWRALALGAGALLETNVRTKSRDDHAEQKMVVLIRSHCSRAAIRKGPTP